MVRLSSLSLLRSSLLFFLLADELRSFTARGQSDDLSRALGVLRRRRRFLEAGVPLTLDPFHHPEEYGTVTHYAPSAIATSKRQYPIGAPEAAYVSAHVPPEAVWRGARPNFREDDFFDPGANEKKRTVARKKKVVKKSVFREREHFLDEKHRKMRKKNNHAAEDELLEKMAERRFLGEVLSEAPQPERIPAPHFDSSGEILGDLSPEEVDTLIALLREREDSMGRFMEGEAPSEARKRALRKRLMWQDAVRNSMGDGPERKRRGRIGEWEEIPPELDNAIDEHWWNEIDPRLLAALAKEEGSYDDSREGFADEQNIDDKKRAAKREPDPWFPAFDLRKRYSSRDDAEEGQWDRKRFVPAKRKRTTSFRERVLHGTGGSEFVGTSKRALPIKRSLSETELKRVVKKNVAPYPQPKVLEELKTIMADDDKDEKKSIKKKREDTSGEDEAVGTSNGTTNDDVTKNEVDEDVFSDEDFSEEAINEYFNGEDNRFKKRETKKWKRSWDDYFGFDGRSPTKKRDGPNDIVVSHDADKLVKPETPKPEVSTSVAVTSLAIHDTVPTEMISMNASAPAEITTAAPEEEHKPVNEWMMNRYFKTMAGAMSSKRKRTVMESDAPEDDGGSGEHPLSAMDHKLEAIENLMLEEALELVEGNGAGDGAGGDPSDQRDKIIHRLDAAHSLEKMREALAEFEGALDNIHEDETPEDDHDDDRKRKKKGPVKKQNLVEALHVMAPQTTKRTSMNEEMSSDEENGCPVFNEIVALCHDLSKQAGDSQRALVGACSRHVMCYACDYAYEDGAQIPCDLVFMREAHDICGDNIYCQSASAQIHGALRQRAPAIERASLPVCLSQSCMRAYRRR